ncbi:MAG TPA: hypothetical protein PLL19_08135, partial [Thiobacillaceae bacterium]|nr:hypothetical protein [Thiobacillaceae bacterium]
KRLQMFTASSSSRPRTHGVAPYARDATAAGKEGGVEERHGWILKAACVDCQLILKTSADRFAGIAT